MNLCFELSMPGSPSWNGKWSGAGRLYAKVVKVADSKVGQEKAKRALDPGEYSHQWPDGWRARISVRKVSGVEITRIKKATRGFCGYDWMVANILGHGSCYDAPKCPPQAPALATTEQ